MTTTKVSKRSAGFTIVELLIVIVVIGILAAISIVSYNGIQDRANDTTVRSDLSNLARQFEIFKVDDGGYPDTTNHLASLNASISKPAYLTQGASINLVICKSADRSEYAIGATSRSGKRLYTLNSSSVREYTDDSDSWTTGERTALAVSVCSSLLPESSHIVTGAGFGDGEWRPWTNG